MERISNQCFLNVLLDRTRTQQNDFWKHWEWKQWGLSQIPIRDRGSNIVNNLKAKSWSSSKKSKKFRRCFYFYMPNSFKWHLYWLYLGCCILVNLISILHHASSWFVWRKVSKLEKFHLRQKLSILIDYRLIIIHYHKLSKAKRVESHIDLIDYCSFVIDYTVVWDNDWFIQESKL